MGTHYKTSGLSRYCFHAKKPRTDAIFTRICNDDEWETAQGMFDEFLPRSRLCVRTPIIDKRGPRGGRVIGVGDKVIHQVIVITNTRVASWRTVLTISICFDPTRNQTMTFDMIDEGSCASIFGFMFRVIFITRCILRDETVKTLGISGSSASRINSACGTFQAASTGHRNLGHGEGMPTGLPSQQQPNLQEFDPKRYNMALERCEKHLSRDHELPSKLPAIYSQLASGRRDGTVLEYEYLKVHPAINITAFNPACNAA
ncbi:hypothetical protein EG329_003870 [Mollisiaceae sp. DMI_Dod_QoI]|nr:hypothetical protein EG329_003870 [Helotiales sp. DMI_Dod_QoI]